MLSIVNKILCILLLLFAGSVAKASLIVNPCKGALSDNFCCDDTSTPIPHISVDFVGPINLKLADPACEFLESPIYSVDLSGATTSHVKPLPAAPTAVLMVLIGFLCVSLVRDRMVWCTVLAGLLWASQTGVQAVPQLVLHLGRRIHLRQRVVAGLSQSYPNERANRPRCDIEGTTYIGLLHHLAGIPDSKDVTHLRCRAGYPDTLVQTKDKFGVPKLKITKLSSFIIHKSNGIAPIAEQPVCFSPAFIFQNLARGPPHSA